MNGPEDRDGCQSVGITVEGGDDETPTSRVDSGYGNYVPLGHRNLGTLGERLLHKVRYLRRRSLREFRLAQKDHGVLVALRIKFGGRDNVKLGGKGRDRASLLNHCGRGFLQADDVTRDVLLREYVQSLGNFLLVQRLDDFPLHGLPDRRSRNCVQHVNEDGVKDGVRDHLQRNRNGLLLRRDGRVLRGLNWGQHFADLHGLRSILSLDRKRGLKYVGAPLLPPKVERGKISLVHVDHSRPTNGVGRVDDVDRVGVPIGHRGEALGTQRLVLHEAGNDGAGFEVTFPELPNLGKILEASGAHVLLKGVVHLVSENLVHRDVLRTRVLDEVLHVHHHLVISRVTLHRYPVLKGVVVDGGNVPSTY
mmetsp:Transcript_21367/g.44483  ORF Transcript_21367/g.44483 Transcript_21367/m.44483 type:complete len:364 (+) Transcript_21367:480-1571(+)